MAEDSLRPGYDFHPAFLPLSIDAQDFRLLGELTARFSELTAGKPALIIDRLKVLMASAYRQGVLDTLATPSQVEIIGGERRYPSFIGRFKPDEALRDIMNFDLANLVNDVYRAGCNEALLQVPVRPEQPALTERRATFKREILAIIESGDSC